MDWTELPPELINVIDRLEELKRENMNIKMQIKNVIKMSGTCSKGIMIDFLRQLLVDFDDQNRSLL